MKIKNTLYRGERETPLYLVKRRLKMDNFSSEALKAGIKPNKPVEEMTDEEIKEFLATINPDSMGFDGEQEGANNENN